MIRFIDIGIKIYKYLSAIFIITCLIWFVIDDYVFLQYFWDSWVMYLTIWGAYIMIYFIAFSMVYWGVVLSSIFIYKKIVEPLKQGKRLCDSL